MVSRTSYLGPVAALLLVAPATAAEPPRPVNLTSAVARTAAEPGWRVEQLADGRTVTIGVNVANGVTHVIGIACGAAHRPEIAVDARGAVAMPRVVALETTNQLTAVPVAPAGASTQGADALLSVLAGMPDGARLSVDDQAFPIAGAREALEPMWKECEQLFGWRITDVNPQQFVWSYVPDPPEPRLVFKGPTTESFVASLTCDPNRGAVTVHVAEVGKGVRKGQAAAFTLEASGESIAIAGKADPARGANLIAGTLTEPELLLTALADATQLGVKTKTTSLTVPTAGLRILLPRFRHACALP